jgi:hypothetical protein
MILKLKRGGEDAEKTVLLSLSVCKSVLLRTVLILIQYMQKSI